MKIYVVCEEDSFGSDPVAAYTSEEAAYEHESRLKHPNGTCSGEVFEIELITDNALLACLDTLQRLTDRVDMVLRGVAEQTELFGLVDEAKEVLNGKEQI